MHTILRLLAVLLMPTTWTLAYIMDDTNQTIQYSPLGRWLGVSCPFCYNDTETYNPYGCNTTDNCHLEIPFIGSGITLYMTLLYTTNFTVSIDGSAPIRFLFTGPPSIMYNFSAYDQQSLPFGNHNLDLMLLDANETADSAHNSNFLFDYVIINETMPFSGTTTSSASVFSGTTTSSASVHQSTKGAVAGAIAGGIAGGFIVLACLIYLVLFRRRRARSTMSDSPPERNILFTEADILSTPFPFNPVDAQGTLQYTSSAIIPTSMSSLLPHKLPGSGDPPFPVPSSASTGTVLPSLLPPASLPLHAVSGDSPFPVPSSIGTNTVLPSLLPPASLPLHADSSVETTTLSDDQLNLLHRLSASNASGSVLAAVAQSMVLGSPDRSHLAQVDVAPPPEYSLTAD